jgi:FAD/FMN-containing dehydrogenase
LHRTFGLSIDNLTSAEIVTADGTVRIASATENPDLFWAIRGAGSNFGVVTWFEFALHPLGPEIYMAVPLFSLDQGERILRTFRDYSNTAPNEVNPQCIVLSVPPVEDFPEELHDKPLIGIQLLYAGDPDVGERELQFVFDWAEPLLDLSGRLPYAASQSGFDGFFPQGWLYYWKSHLLPELTDDAIDAIAEIARERPSPRAMINIWPLGGAIRNVAPSATPWNHRDAGYLLSLDTTWTDPADSERCIAWTREMWRRMQPYGQGAYLNFAGFGEEKEALVRASYGQNYDRLVEIKTKYDPGNLFRMNNNIKPA